MSAAPTPDNPPPSHSSPGDGGAPPETSGATEQIHRAGKVRPMVLLWALGVPLPIVLIIALVRGCG